MRSRFGRRSCGTGIAAVLCTVVVTACGGGGTSSAKFCSEAQAFTNATPAPGSAGDQQAVAHLERMRAVAPSSLRPDLDTVLRFARIQTASSPATLSEAELQKVYDATTRISTYITDKCRIMTTGTTG